VDEASPGAHATPTLLDVAWIVAKNGYAADVWRCCGICREQWRWIAPELSEEDAARVRRDHPFWQAIINLTHGKYGATRLKMAADRGELARVEALIAWHANVNIAAIDGDTALMLASYSGHVEVVRALIAAGAGANAAVNTGETALIFASGNGHVEIVRALLAAGAGIDAAASNGSTALVRASDKGHVGVVRVLLAASAGVREQKIRRAAVTAHRSSAAAAGCSSAPPPPPPGSSTTASPSTATTPSPRVTSVAQVARCVSPRAAAVAATVTRAVTDWPT
jgi:predicted LPLAT superfamily acyltransferase